MKNLEFGHFVDVNSPQCGVLFLTAFALDAVMVPMSRDNLRRQFQ